ncbi:MAG TPA: sigma factor-like helix-turn-helix DNA-binding protein [Sedimentisphaerales bacterium]|nr:sigma factor-like helix-turn-helix DNA-binding protein [Sedimentisphaerales bacterium]
MAKMIDPNKPLTQLELDIVYMRYFEGLHSSEIAEQLGIELEKVKDKMKKPNVARYICRIVLPYKRRQRIAKLVAACIVPIITVNALVLAGILVFSLLAIFSITLLL